MLPVLRPCVCGSGDAGDQALAARVDKALRFPFNQRWLLGIWKALYFKEGRFTPNASRSKQWNRGAYLVEGPGHCGACHTPRNFLGAEQPELAMTGGTHREEVADGKIAEWSSSNLTPTATGLRAWSVDDIVAYLTTGFTPRAGVFGPMNEMVMNSTRHLSAEDGRTMAIYLKSLGALTQKGGSPPDDEVMRNGELAYSIHCGTSHLPTGLGSEETRPPLAGSSVALSAIRLH